MNTSKNAAAEENNFLLLSYLAKGILAEVNN